MVKLRYTFVVCRSIPPTLIGGARHGGRRNRRCGLGKLPRTRQPHLSSDKANGERLARCSSTLNLLLTAMASIVQVDIADDDFIAVTAARDLKLKTGTTSAT